MRFIWLKCSCGHEGSRPARDGEWEALRGEILARSSCSQCGMRQAVDMRKFWNVGDVAMEGSRPIERKP